MDAINNQKNLTLEHIAIEFPSIEHEVFKNKLIIYGKYISRDKFGPVAYVFNSLPELAFDSENCQKIYSFIKAHTQKNRRVLLKIDYGNITSKSSQFTIGYDL